MCIELDGSDLQHALEKARSRRTLWIAFLKPLVWHNTLFSAIPCNSRRNPSCHWCHPVRLNQIFSYARLASACVRKEPGVRVQISTSREKGTGCGAWGSVWAVRQKASAGMGRVCVCTWEWMCRKQGQPMILYKDWCIFRAPTLRHAEESGVFSFRKDNTVTWLLNEQSAFCMCFIAFRQMNEWGALKPLKRILPS